MPSPPPSTNGIFHSATKTWQCADLAHQQQPVVLHLKVVGKHKKQMWIRLRMEKSSSNTDAWTVALGVSDEDGCYDEIVRTILTSAVIDSTSVCPQTVQITLKTLGDFFNNGRRAEFPVTELTDVEDLKQRLLARWKLPYELRLIYDGQELDNKICFKDEHQFTENKRIDLFAIDQVSTPKEEKTTTTTTENETEQPPHKRQRISL